MCGEALTALSAEGEGREGRRHETPSLPQLCVTSVGSPLPSACQGNDWGAGPQHSGLRGPMSSSSASGLPTLPLDAAVGPSPG